MSLNSFSLLFGMRSRSGHNQSCIPVAVAKLRRRWRQKPRAASRRRRRRLPQFVPQRGQVLQRPADGLDLERRLVMAQLEQVCQMAKFDPFLSLDCIGVEGVGAESKERMGSNFAA